MKKIFSLCFLILILCFGSCVFGSVNWGVNDLEKFLSCYGADIDFANATYVATTTYQSSSFSTLSSYLSDSRMPLIIFRNTYNSGLYDSSLNLYEHSDEIDFVFYNALTSNAQGRQLLLNNNTDEGYYYRFNYTSYAFAVDADTNTVYRLDNYNYIHNNWFESSLNISHEEFISRSYQEFLLREYGLIYTEVALYSNEGSVLVKNEGGRIFNNSAYDDTTYKGSIYYYPTTESTSFSLTEGFSTETNYDLFLEIYRFDNDYTNGIGEYPIDTLNLGTVTTADTSKTIDISKVLKSSFYGYRLCVGVNNFETSGTNEIYICTDWLLPNDNSVRKYVIFSQCHLFKFLSLVDFDLNYDFEDELHENIGGSSSGDIDNNNGENGGDIGSDIEDYLPYFISVPAYPQKNECLVYFYVGDYGLNNLSFLIEKIDDSGAILSSNTLSTSIINNVNYGMAKVDFCKYFKFEDNSFYKITLVGKNGVKLDTSSVIYFLGSNTGNYEGDKPYIINAPKGYVRNSGDVVVTVYMPSGYDYEDSVYLSVQKYNLSGDYIGSTVIGDSNMWLQLDSESGICPIYVSSFCDFDTSGNYYYRINLNEFNNGTLDITDIFYFDIDTGENIDKDNLPINPNDPSFNFDATDMEGLINSTTTWTNTIFSFLNIFPPWLITSIMAGIAVVVICRILGR